MILKFYYKYIHKNLEKITQMAVKKQTFSSQIQNVPNLKFFTMKKLILTPHKTSHTLLSEAMYQNVPLNEINVP